MQHQDFRVDLIFRFLHEYRSHIYSHILCICIGKNTHTHTKHTISLPPKAYKHSHLYSIHDKVFSPQGDTIRDDFCLSLTKHHSDCTKHLLLMLDSLPTAQNCLHESIHSSTTFPPESMQSDVHLLVNKQNRKSSPRPHRTAMEICSSVSLARARENALQGHFHRSVFFIL